VFIEAKDDGGGGDILEL